MILLLNPIPQPKSSFYIKSLEENTIIAARREAVLSIVSQSNGLTLQEIAIKANQDIHTTQAILTVLKRYGKIESEYTQREKLWRAVL